MNILFRFIIFCFDPLGIGRRIFFRPLFNLCSQILNRFKSKADAKVGPLKELVLRLGLIAFAVTLIIWTATFMYAVFYYTYMPAISHTRPVNMQFKTCLDTNMPCSFPHAHVPLTKKQQLLTVGQAYRVLVYIEMPESPQNLELGMFMVCGEMRDHQSMLRGHSCRSAMMRYQSPLIRTITTWALSPLYVLGLKEEFQRVPVEIFSRYMEEQHHPITDVYVEIQSQKIQYYTVTLHIVADFAGLRYLMHNWPVFSAIVGISTNLFLILVVFLLSWYHWSDTTWLRKLQGKYLRISNTLQDKASKAIVESSSTFRDDEELSFLDEKSNSSEIEDINGSSSGKEEALSKPASKTNEEQTLRQRKAHESEA